MAIVLWALGSVPFLVLGALYAWRFHVATRRSLGRDQGPGSEVSRTFGGAMWSEYFKRQTDPQRETLRRRAWLCVFFLYVYAVLGYRVWAAVVGWLSL